MATPSTRHWRRMGKGDELDRYIAGLLGYEVKQDKSGHWCLIQDGTPGVINFETEASAWAAFSMRFSRSLSDALSLPLTGRFQFEISVYSDRSCRADILGDEYRTGESASDVDFLALAVCLSWLEWWEVFG